MLAAVFLHQLQRRNHRLLKNMCTHTLHQGQQRLQKNEKFIAAAGIFKTTTKKNRSDFAKTKMTCLNFTIINIEEKQ